jgi:hypothetical protein
MSSHLSGRDEPPAEAVSVATPQVASAFAATRSKSSVDLENGASVRCSVEKIERSVEDLALRFDITGGAERSPHRMGRDHDPRKRHAFRNMCERFHHHHDRRRA